MPFHHRICRTTQTLEIRIRPKAAQLCSLVFATAPLAEQASNALLSEARCQMTDIDASIHRLASTRMITGWAAARWPATLTPAIAGGMFTALPTPASVS